MKNLSIALLLLSLGVSFLPNWDAKRIDAAVTPTTTGAFSVEIKQSSETVFPFEPLFLLAVAQNTSKEIQSFASPPYCFAHALYEHAQPSTTSVFGPGDGSSATQESMKLEPGERVTMMRVFDQSAPSHAFSHAGTCILTLGIEGIPSFKMELRITVVKPPMSEDEVLAYLADHPCCICNTEEEARSLVDDGAEKHLKEMTDFINKFPKSRYADWCRFGSLLVEQAQAGLNPNKLYEVQQKMQTLAPALILPARAQCWFAAGRIASIRQYDDEAEKDFAEAIRSKGSNAMAEQIIAFRANAQLSKVSPTVRIPQTEDEIFAPVLNELESKRYDPRGFVSDYPEGSRKYEEAIVLLLERRKQTNMKDEEFFFIAAQEFRRCVLQYAKPLSEAEWRKRQASYQLEDQKKRSATAPTQDK